MNTSSLFDYRARKDDTILVAGGPEPALVAAMSEGNLQRWLRAASGARRLGSVCTGAFVLAHAGLLDGRRVATHWAACERLARFRPQATVDPSAIFVQDGNLWTSAGVTTGIDMALAMVEEDLGAPAADSVAARLVLYARRPGFQSQFSTTLVAQLERSNPFGPLLLWARAHLTELSPECLARRAGQSPRTFHRHCVDLIGTTPAKLIEKLRVEQARTLLATTSAPTKAVARDAGFGSVDRMTRAFVRELGVAPRTYRTLFEGRDPDDRNAERSSPRPESKRKARPRTAALAAPAR